MYSVLRLQYIYSVLVLITIRYLEYSVPCSVEAELINTNVRIVCEFPQFAESSEANVAGEHCAQLAMMMPLPWGAGRAMLGVRDGRSAQPARRYVVTEQPENGVRS